MDLLITILIVISIGGIRIYKTTGFSSLPLMDLDGSISLSEERPIGTNLLLKREPDAFTLILKELGLIK